MPIVNFVKPLNKIQQSGRKVKITQFKQEGNYKFVSDKTSDYLYKKTFQKNPNPVQVSKPEK